MIIKAAAGDFAVSLTCLKVNAEPVFEQKKKSHEKMYEKNREGEIKVRERGVEKIGYPPPPYTIA